MLELAVRRANAFAGPVGNGGPRSVVERTRMNRFSRLVLSSVGSKYVMALTGLGLMIFVIAHMSGNLLIYGGRDVLNAYAHGLTEHPVLLWSARGGLLAIFVIHILYALRTWQDNESARPIGYV